jgi:two-component sensor histidine kinase
MLQRFWNAISTIGLENQYDDGLKKRVVLGNQFTFIAFLIFVFSMANGFLLKDFKSVYVLAVIAFVTLFSFVFQKKHLHTFANSFVLSVISISVFFFISNLGVNSGAFLFNFPILMSIAFVLDVMKDKLLMVFHFSLIVILYLINVFTHFNLFTSEFVTDEIRSQMFTINFILSFSAVSFFVYLFVASSIRESKALLIRLEEKNESQRIISGSLKEKSVLVSELHHRVKNNLAIISSLFNLRITDDLHEDAKKVLVDSSNRVYSMALIHNQLYQSEQLHDLDFGIYANTLIDQINESYPMMDKKILIEKNIDSIYLDINTAIPCGLILNELLTNCYKYAFALRIDGRIVINFTKRNKKCIMTVKDNGCGLPDDYLNKQSLGITVIEAFTEQLDGNHFYKNDNGTYFELNFDVKS